MPHLLRIEAVNLAACIDDTEDLSTRRGGSLMLLQAVQEMARRFSDRMTAVKTGASTGLFELHPGQDAPALAEAIRAELRGHPLYRHGSFVVEAAAAEGFHSAADATLHAGRWRQMRSLSFSPVGLADAADGPCRIDEHRPASATNTFKGQRDTPVSASVAVRRGHGREHKQDLYEQELAQLPPAEQNPHWRGLRYTADFEDLAQEPCLSVEPATLVGKIGVFYADGNGFGQRLRDCGGAEEVRAWEAHYSLARRRFLAAVVERARSEPRWQTATGALRLETLLWGGDELMLVLPGWCALELADLFFEATAGLRWPADAAAEDSDKRLTHACGLVLCHLQAPISGISQLARRLAERGKKVRHNADSLNWMLLENFDQAGGDLDGFLATRYPGSGLGWPDLTLTPAALATLRRNLPDLKPLLPRSALLRAARLMVERVLPGDPAHRLLRRSWLQVHGAVADAAAQLRWQACWRAVHPEGRAWPERLPALDDTVLWTDLIQPRDLAAWITLLELWDYLPHWSAPPAETATPTAGPTAAAEGAGA